MESFVDSTGTPLRLGPSVGRVGGEGKVLELADRPGLLAKLYHTRPRPDQIAKLRHLIRVRSDQVGRFTAWPSGLVLDQTGSVRGFLMPRVSGCEVHQVYHPRERAARFPDAHWDFLVHVARNCAAAFDEVHRLGAIIGDVNEGNVLVRDNGTVMLIDCDSYQAQHQGTTWGCDVGVPLWTAPELQGKPFRGLIRVRNHDLFGLALLIFHLLFMGRHPFVGVPFGHDGVTPDRAIAEFKFVFSASKPLPDLAPPASCPTMASLPGEIRVLFDRAFLQGSGNDGSRPEAHVWAIALEQLARSLRACPQSEAHLYWKGAPSCPWCTVRRNGGPDFFAAATINAVPVLPKAVPQAPWRGLSSRFGSLRRAVVAGTVLLGVSWLSGLGHIQPPQPQPAPRALPVNHVAKPLHHATALRRHHRRAHQK
ncbi:MAG TPA: hypothetical protein VGD78_08700 [Chthoniobacterales bacterium]